MDKRIVLLGPPGAGKGTQAEILAKTQSLKHLNTGSMLRKAIADQTPLGLMIKNAVENGRLAPDDVVVKVIMTAIAGVEGYILDGFPRTIAQAEALNQNLTDSGEKIDRAVLLEIDDATIIDRLASRRNCSGCGSVYNLNSKPPIFADICDNCHGVLSIRTDDKPNAIATRLQAYWKDTRPLVEYYEKQGLLATVKADATPDEVTKQILRIIN